MIYYYPQHNAYDVIQREIEENFHSSIGKTREEIKVIVIVGAYHGYEISRILNNYPNCKIYAFEAVPQHFKILEKNYENNKRVILINKAVSDKCGFIDFYELGNGGEGSGSILKFQGNKYGHSFIIKEELHLPCTTILAELGEIDIDLLWIDVQGAELSVLKGAKLNNCRAIFMEIHTHDYVNPWDKEPYKGQCFKEDLEAYMLEFYIHSIGLDNKSGNGQGNSFWLRK